MASQSFPTVQWGIYVLSRLSADGSTDVNLPISFKTAGFAAIASQSGWFSQLGIDVSLSTATIFRRASSGTTTEGIRIIVLGR